MPRPRGRYTCQRPLSLPDGLLALFGEQKSCRAQTSDASQRSNASFLDETLIHLSRTPTLIRNLLSSSFYPRSTHQIHPPRHARRFPGRILPTRPPLPLARPRPCTLSIIFTLSHPTITPLILLPPSLYLTPTRSLTAAAATTVQSTPPQRHLPLRCFPNPFLTRTPLTTASTRSPRTLSRTMGPTAKRRSGRRGQLVCRARSST
jgi:hypothetical protein